MKNRNRIFALLLSVMMVFTYMPALAFAEDEEPVNTDPPATEQVDGQNGDELTDPDTTSENKKENEEPEDSGQKGGDEGSSQRIINITGLEYKDDEGNDRILYGYEGEKTLVNYPLVGDTIYALGYDGETYEENIKFIATEKTLNGEDCIVFESEKEGSTDYFIADSLCYKVSSESSGEYYKFTYYESPESEGDPDFSEWVNYSVLTGDEEEVKADGLTYEGPTLYYGADKKPSDVYPYMDDMKFHVHFTDGSVRTIVLKEWDDDCNYFFEDEEPVFEGGSVLPTNTAELNFDYDNASEEGLPVSYYDAKTMIPVKRAAKVTSATLETPEDAEPREAYIGTINYQFEPIPGETLTISFDNGESKVYTATEIEYDEDYTVVYFMDSEGNRLYCEGDNSKPITEGENTLEVGFWDNDAELSASFTYTVIGIKSDVESVEYESVSPVIAVKAPEQDYCDYKTFVVGDKMVFTFSDGSHSSYTNKIFEMEDGSYDYYFVNDDNPKDYFWPDYWDDQEDNPWNQAGTYYCYFFTPNGGAGKIPIKVMDESPVSSIEFIPLESPVTVGYNACYNETEFDACYDIGNRNKDYGDFFIAGDKLIVNYKEADDNGATTEEYEYTLIGDFYMWINAKTGNGSAGRIEVDPMVIDATDEIWNIGETKPITIHFLGAETKIDVMLVSDEEASNEEYENAKKAAETSAEKADSAIKAAADAKKTADAAKEAADKATPGTAEAVEAAKNAAEKAEASSKAAEDAKVAAEKAKTDAQAAVAAAKSDKEKTEAGGMLAAATDILTAATDTASKAKTASDNAKAAQTVAEDAKAKADAAAAQKKSDDAKKIADEAKDAMDKARTVAETAKAAAATAKAAAEAAGKTPGEAAVAAAEAAVKAAEENSAAAATLKDLADKAKKAAEDAKAAANNSDAAKAADDLAKAAAQIATDAAKAVTDAKAAVEDAKKAAANAKTAAENEAKAVEAAKTAQETADKSAKAASDAKAAAEAAKKTADEAKAAADKAKPGTAEAVEAAKKAATAAETAKKAADAYEAAANKAKTDAQAASDAANKTNNAIAKTKAAASVNAADKNVADAKAVTAAAKTASDNAKAAVTAAENAKKAADEIAANTGTPEVTLSATDFTYKYAVKKVKVGKKKKKQAVATVQVPAVTSVKLNGKALTAADYDATYSNAESSALGQYKVTVTLKGKYKGTGTATYNINPKPAKISKPAKGKKKMTVKWKKAAKNDITYKALDGYEIQYSLTPDFSSADTRTTTASKKAKSKAIKKLQSKQTYYVRIRTYKNAGGVRLYSGWSAVKSVKVK